MVPARRRAQTEPSSIIAADTDEVMSDYLAYIGGLCRPQSAMTLARVFARVIDATAAAAAQSLLRMVAC